MKNIIIILFAMYSGRGFSKDIECEYHGKIALFKGVQSKMIDETRKESSKLLNFHIENVDKPSEANDYVEIKEKNRSITYVLNCKIVD